MPISILHFSNKKANLFTSLHFARPAFLSPHNGSHKRFTSIQAVFIRLASLRSTSPHFASFRFAAFSYTSAPFALLILYSFQSNTPATSNNSGQSRRKTLLSILCSLKNNPYFFGHLLQWFTNQQFFDKLRFSGHSSSGLRGKTTPGRNEKRKRLID